MLRLTPRASLRALEGPQAHDAQGVVPQVEPRQGGVPLQGILPCKPLSTLVIESSMTRAAWESMRSVHTLRLLSELLKANFSTRWEIGVSSPACAAQVRCL